MADINLLQSQLKDTTVSSSNKTSLFVTIAVILLICLLVGCGLFYILTQSTVSKTAEVLDDNISIEANINKASKDLDEAKALQAKLANTDMLLKKHMLATPLLEELEKHTYVRSKYITADFDAKESKVHLEGAAPSYADLGKLILGLSTSEYFQNVKLLAVSDAVGAAGTGKAYQFSIDMNVTPKIFTKN